MQNDGAPGRARGKVITLPLLKERKEKGGKNITIKRWE